MVCKKDQKKATVFTMAFVLDKKRIIFCPE